MNFTAPEIEIVIFANEDVITSSGSGNFDNETDEL